MMDKKKSFVLVVEDDHNSQMLMNYYLRESYEIDFAVSVTEAKEKLISQDADIILLDLSLEGGEDGLDLVKYMRTKDKFRSISVIATTAHAFTADREKCLEAGCNDYISKPIKKDKLLKMMSKYHNGNQS